MTRDVGAASLDAVGAVTTLWELDWEPASSIGQAYAAGQSTGDIAWGVITGLADSVDNALDAAADGDYAPLLNLSGEVAVEVLLMRGLGKAGRHQKLGQNA